MRNSRNKHSAKKTQDGKAKFMSAGHEVKPQPVENIVLELKAQRGTNGFWLLGIAYERRSLLPFTYYIIISFM